MTIDYYALTKEIADALEAEGLTVEATALRDEIAAGSTGTEILMGIRWYLKEIDSSKKSTNVTTKRQMRDLIAELDRVLSA